MKRYLVIFSIMVVAMLALIDAKTRMDELDDVAATTPSQVEMKREIPKSTGAGIPQKMEQTPSQLAFPQSKQNDPNIQNMPHKLNPQFRDLNTPKPLNQSP